MLLALQTVICHARSPVFVQSVHSIFFFPLLVWSYFSQSAALQGKRHRVRSVYFISTPDAFESIGGCHEVSQGNQWCPIKSQSSKCSIKNMAQWFCEGSLGRIMPPVFKTISLKVTLMDIENLWITLFGQSDCQSYSFKPPPTSVSMFSVSSDLDNFKTQSVRSAVNVREGQGVVLLCGPPPHSGGKFAICCCYLNTAHKNYLHWVQTANIDE